MAHPYSFFDQFLNQRIEDLPPGDPLYVEGNKISQAVTSLVDMLRNPKMVPLDRINDLAVLGWDLIGNHITPCAVGNVSTVCFGAEVINVANPEQERASIFVPMDFVQRCQENIVFQMGAMVFAISQARDFWNNKLAWVVEGRLIDGREDVKTRARIYESEFLHLFKDKGYSYHEYQQKVMEEFPEGWDSRPDLWYDSEPYVEGRKVAHIQRPHFGDN